MAGDSADAGFAVWVTVAVSAAADFLTTFFLTTFFLGVTFFFATFFLVTFFFATFFFATVFFFTAAFFFGAAAVFSPASCASSFLSLSTMSQLPSRLFIQR
ncbi:MAG: hypothetical protein ABW116_13075 [Candidatus Sedimenticola sp. 20ELBAFRAG]